MNEYVRIALDLADRVSRVYETVEFWQPVAQLPGIMDLPYLAAPSLALGSLLSLVALGAVAIGSMVALVTALLLAALILDQIFGVAVELGT